VKDIFKADINKKPSKAASNLVSTAILGSCNWKEIDTLAGGCFDKEFYKHVINV
jgi:hypothetical protein